MILMKSEFTMKNIGVIYQQLKRALDTVMKKINMKSKKFIQILQTLLRAVQFALEALPSIPDADTASLLLAFYKLLFLGTPFSAKMLKLQVEVQRGGRPQLAGQKL